MRILKGLLTIMGTGMVFLFITYALAYIKMRAIGSQAADLQAIWVWMLSSPLYWLTVLALLGSCVWLFRHWVIAH